MIAIARNLFDLLPFDDAVTVLCAIIAFFHAITALGLAIVIVGLVMLHEQRRNRLVPIEPDEGGFGDLPRLPQDSILPIRRGLRSSPDRIGSLELPSGARPAETRRMYAALSAGRSVVRDPS